MMGQSVAPQVGPLGRLHARALPLPSPTVSQTNLNSRAREMDKVFAVYVWPEYRPHPHYLCKKPGMAAGAYNPSSEEAETGGSLGLASQLV